MHWFLLVIQECSSVSKKQKESRTEKRTSWDTCIDLMSFRKQEKINNWQCFLPKVLISLALRLFCERWAHWCKIVSCEWTNLQWQFGFDKNLGVHWSFLTLSRFNIPCECLLTNFVSFAFIVVRGHSSTLRHGCEVISIWETRNRLYNSNNFIILLSFFFAVNVSCLCHIVICKYFWKYVKGSGKILDFQLWIFRQVEVFLMDKSIILVKI